MQYHPKMTSNKSITLLKDVEPFKSCWCVQVKFLHSWMATNQLWWTVFIFVYFDIVNGFDTFCCLRFQDPLFMQEVMIYRKEKHRSMLEELEALPKYILNRIKAYRYWV